MKILITGIHGFVGSNLVQELSKIHDIYGLDIINPQRDGVIKTFNWEDLKERKLPQCDVIIHLAGKAHDTKNVSLAEDYFKVNTELTKIIFDFFVKSSSKIFIFFSSIKAAVDHSADVVTEEVDPKPIGPYGESKIKAEEYILSKRELLDKEKKYYILRPCMIHGPGNKGNLNLLYNFVKKGIPYPLGKYDNQRSFTSIDNLKYIIKRIIDDSIASGIYNVGDDEPISTNDLVDIISTTMNKKPRIWKFPKSLITLVAKISDIFRLPLTSERLEKLTENYVVSNSKIKKALGVTSLPVKAKDGLKSTIKYFNEQ